MGSDALADLAELIIAGDGDAASALTAKLLAEGLGARETSTGASCPAWTPSGRA